MTGSSFDRLELRFHEIALLEVLRDWPTTAESDWPGLLTVVRELESKGLVDVEHLKRSVRGEPPHARNLVFSLAS